MPSFSLMTEPSLASSTASVSPSACFFRNFFRPGGGGGGEGAGEAGQGQGLEGQAHRQPAEADCGAKQPGMRVM